MVDIENRLFECLIIEINMHNFNYKICANARIFQLHTFVANSIYFYYSSHRYHDADNSNIM